MKFQSTQVRPMNEPSPFGTNRMKDCPFETGDHVFRATLLEIQENGQLCVCTQNGTETACDWLQMPGTPSIPLQIGDVLLVVLPGGDRQAAVALGRIGRYAAPTAQTHLTLEASQSLTLRCGESSVDLRADGKVMIRGEDVLVRAKGTQRIRAGTVSIN